MFIVASEYEGYYFFNKKENAIKKAKEFYNKELERFARDWYNGDIEEAKKEIDYDDEIKEIENGKYNCDWVKIEEIETED